MPPSQRTELAVPADLEKVVMACLEKEPGDRPASVVELSEMLAACDAAGGWTEAQSREWWELHMEPPDTMPNLERPGSG